MKKNIYVCITESLCCTAEMNTISSQLYFSIFFLKKEIWAQWMNLGDIMLSEVSQSQDKRHCGIPLTGGP